MDAVKLLGVCTVTMALVMSGSEGYVLQVCGSSLAEALSLACRVNGYAEKRSSGSSGMGTAGELLGSSGFVRPRRGVVDECCRRVCTLPTLMSYCAAGHVPGQDLEQLLRLIVSAQGSDASVPRLESSGSRPAGVIGRLPSSRDNYGRVTEVGGPFFFVTPTKRQAEFARPQPADSSEH